MVDVVADAVRPTGWTVWEVRAVGDHRFVEVVYVRGRYKGIEPGWDKVLILQDANLAPRVGDRATVVVTEAPS
jgi:hypothetical protein